MIKIYNSLTRKKEEFRPLKPPQVGMYVCGPTVYDEPHIGHARSAYIFDVVRRYLEYRGYQVKFVRNVTDVDDKIIEKARTEYQDEDLFAAVKKVATKYLDAYHRSLQKLGIDQDSKVIEPKASDYIPKMVKYIQDLIDKGAAYQAGGDVYFDITKAKDYGKLSGQSLDKMEAGARVLPTENKKNPLDFALWKAAKQDEPSWDSLWSRGRPGWHIECSVMSSDILGREFDIHGGGMDLIFPHHENEIAQSEGAGNKFARYWMHHGLLTINGQKMAKSLGNFVTIEDFIKKYRDPDLLKLFFLSAHYAHPIDYSQEKIEETKRAMERVLILVDKLKSQKSQVRSQESKEIEKIKARFIEAMDDDFNTPEGLASIFDLVNLTNKHITALDFVSIARDTLLGLLDIFGISLKAKKEVGQITDQKIEIKIRQREKARDEKNYALADKIRKDLQDLGVILEDTKGKTTWRKKL